MANSFHSPSLRVAMQECTRTFDSFVPTLNQISEDIKAVESFFKSRNVSLEFRKRVHDYFLEDDDVNPNFDTNIIYLKWGRYRDHGFRLLLTETEENERFHAYKVVSEKPLIECPLEERASAHKVLDSFVWDFSRELEMAFDGYFDVSEDERE